MADIEHNPDAISYPPDQREHRRLLPSNGIPVTSLSAYEDTGGWIALRQVQQVQPEVVIDELTRSGLRGRGGAGFLTGAKWASIRQEGTGTRYVCCNGAEGEPGTFKDRYLLRMNPYQVLEGVAIAAYTIGAPQAFICLKQSFSPEINRLQNALDELMASGILGAPPFLEITLVLGPEEYFFGEEKALLEVVEGNLPLPRWLPPYIEGLFIKPNVANPTLVNNVETLANVPHILRHGAEWFRQVGTTDSPGTMICTVCEDVQRPGCYELPLGTPLRVLIEELGGGVRPGRALKAILPGVSNAVLTVDDLDERLTFDTLRDAGSGLGSAGFIVYDDTACMVKVAALLSRFLYVESCEQCLPCKVGSGEITAALDRLVQGVGGPDDIGRIRSRCGIVATANRCALPVGERVVVESILNTFPEEFEDHDHTPCPHPRTLILPKLVDYDAASHAFTYDPLQSRKQPDWTYVTAPDEELGADPVTTQGREPSRRDDQ